MYSSMALATSDDGEGPEALRAMVLRHQPPENEVGGTLAGAHVLAQTEDVAVVLHAARCYSMGLELDLRIALRTFRPHRRLHDETWEAVQQAWVGVELADGTRVVSRSARHGLTVPEDPATHTLSTSGGGGGGRTYRTTYWLTPAPPEGDVVVVVALPLLGVPETRHVLPGAALAAARADAVELWPWEPDPEPETVEPERGEVPEGGWFAETLG